MKKLSLIFILSIIFIGHVFGEEKISREEAIKIAEEFIRIQGYTDFPPTQDEEEIRLESITRAETKEQLFDFRHNTLQAKAIGIKSTDHPTPNGWGVAFDYVNYRKEEDSCRVVTMDSDGSNVRMQHINGKRSGWLGFND